MKKLVLFILSMLVALTSFSQPKSSQTEANAAIRFPQGSAVLDSVFPIPDEVIAVRFEYNSSNTDGRIISSPDSDTPIYGNLEDSVWVVRTPAGVIYANPSCSEMFGDKENIRTIDFGEGFKTDYVRDMSAMFVDCHNLTSLDLSSFNTANVTDMGWVFQDCKSLTNLDLSIFNMDHVKEKEKMCSNLATTSGACTITCPTAVRIAL